MIELIKIAQKFPGEIINEIATGKIHVVCMAQNGLTHLNVYAELYCKIPKQLVNQSVDLVNSKKETGTLFPQAYISILPKSAFQLWMLMQVWMIWRMELSMEKEKVMSMLKNIITNLQMNTAQLHGNLMV